MTQAGDPTRSTSGGGRQIGRMWGCKYPGEFYVINPGGEHLKLNTLLVKLDESNIKLLGEVVEAPVNPDLYNGLVQMSERFRAAPGVKLPQPQPQVVPGLPLSWRMSSYRCRLL